MDGRVPKVNPDVNYGLWVIRMYKCRSIGCNKCTTLIWDIDSRGRCAYMGQGTIWGSLGAFRSLLL